jgi:hypothetical protein
MTSINNRDELSSQMTSNWSDCLRLSAKYLAYLAQQLRRKNVAHLAHQLTRKKVAHVAHQEIADKHRLAANACRGEVKKPCRIDSPPGLQSAGLQGFGLRDAAKAPAWRKRKDPLTGPLVEKAVIGSD